MRGETTPSRLIVADPPWLERGSGRVKRGADRHYDLLDVDGIVLAMLRANLADGSPAWNPNPEGCHVWFWVTANRLLDGVRVLDALGVRYVTNRAWFKARPATVASTSHLRALVEDLSSEECPSRRGELLDVERDLAAGLYVPERFGLGQYLRGAHELALFGVIGNRPSATKTVPSVLVAPRGAHSEKPAAFFEDAARIAGAIPGERVEFFGRGPREGWRVWGAESSGSTSSPAEAFLSAWKVALEAGGIDWITQTGIFSPDELDELRESAPKFVARRSAADVRRLASALEWENGT